MQPDFWLECWQSNKLGFHLDEVHPLLVLALQRLALPGGRVFVPLCGKSTDLLYLSEYAEVVGNELSAIACHDFFVDNKLSHSEIPADGFNCFQANNISILQGDFFTLTKALLGDVSWVYDRAALIALPAQMRQLYAAHLTKLLPPGGRIVLITLEYPEHEKQGPPFTVLQNELYQLFPDAEVELITTSDITGKGFAKRRFATSYLTEKLYLVTLPA